MNGAAAIRANFEAGDWQAPDMAILTGGRGAAAIMPTGLFGQLWPLISDLADGAGSPVDYVAVSVLAVAASLIGATRRVQPFATSPQWQEPCILWLAPVGDPSSNKSPAIDAATLPLRAIEAELAEAHKRRLFGHQTALERSKAERAKWQDQVKAAVRDGDIATPPMPDAADEPNEPCRRRLMVQDATPEALGEILAGNPNGVLHLRDELAGWLTSFERYAAGGREFWLEAYGGRAHVIDRKSLKVPLTIPFNGVTVLGGIQPEKLADCLLSVADDGLVARFLWAWPRAIRYRRPENLADVAQLERVYRRLHGLVPMLSEGADRPLVLLLDDGAADIFEAWAAENGDSIEDAASLYKGFVGKLPGTALRLSLVAELLAWAAGPSSSEPETVSAASITAAITFIEEYAKPTALRVFGDAALPVAERNAALLARHILKSGAREINGRDIRRAANLPTLKKADLVDEALDALVEAGWVRPSPSRSGTTPGRAAKNFTVNPGVFGAGS